MKRWAHLLDPLPQERDVEDNLGDNTHASSFRPADLGDEYRQQTQQLLDSSSSAGKLRRNLLRSAVSLELGPKYAGGEVISREDLFQDGPGSAKRPNDSTLSADVDSALSDLDNDESSDSNYKETGKGQASTLNTDDISKRLRQLQEEDLVAVSATKERVESPYHVANQKTLWDSLLKTRIGLQQLLANSHKLPPSREHALFCAHTERAPSAFGSTAQAVKGLARELLDLQELLDCTAGGTEDGGAQDNASSEDSSARDTTEHLWATMQKRFHDRLVPRFSELSDWWGARSRALGGGMQRLKVINQSIVKQVDMVMANKEELVQKSRVRRSSSRILGLEKKDTVQPHESIYDDGDFYQTLLMDFIQASSAGGTAAKKSKSKRKRVDRRASKGRKLRFHVHPKLMNFVAPDPHGSARVDVRQLFSSILGNSVK